MNLQTSITDFANYNLWANQQYVNWLSTKTEAQLNQEVPSSYSSILKTLNHIWGVEEYWYSIITQTEGFENRFAVTHLNADEIFKGLINRSALLVNAIKLLTEAELVEKLAVINPWFEGNLLRYEYVQQTVNHATYHRGQIVTMGRNIDITDAPVTDYIFFAVAKAAN